MKALEYFRARKIQKQVGDKHEKDVATWKTHHKKMVAEMQKGSFKPIKLQTEYMPDHIIFYNISGSKMLNKDTMVSIDTTTIDNSYDLNHTQHIMPTYFLVRNGDSKEPVSVNNTTMYRIVYNKSENSSDYTYTIDTLIPNEETATSEIFPELFCSIQVTPPKSTSYYRDSPKHEQTYSPLPNYKDSARYARIRECAQLEEFYNGFVKKAHQFANHPSSEYNPDKEM